MTLHELLNVFDLLITIGIFYFVALTYIEIK